MSLLLFFSSLAQEEKGNRVHHGRQTQSVFCSWKHCWILFIWQVEKRLSLSGLTGCQPSSPQSVSLFFLLFKKNLNGNKKIIQTHKKHRAADWKAPLWMVATASWTSMAPCHSSSPLTAARPRGRTLKLGWAGFAYKPHTVKFSGVCRGHAWVEKNKLLYNHCSLVSANVSFLNYKAVKAICALEPRASWRIKEAEECFRVMLLGAY